MCAGGKSEATLSPKRLDSPLFTKNQYKQYAPFIAVLGVLSAVALASLWYNIDSNPSFLNLSDPSYDLVQIFGFVIGLTILAIAAITMWLVTSRKFEFYEDMVRISGILRKPMEVPYAGLKIGSLRISPPSNPYCSFKLLYSEGSYEKGQPNTVSLDSKGAFPTLHESWRESTITIKRRTEQTTFFLYDWLLEKIPEENQVRIDSKSVGRGLRTQRKYALFYVFFGLPLIGIGLTVLIYLVFSNVGLSNIAIDVFSGIFAVGIVLVSYGATRMIRISGRHG